MKKLLLVSYPSCALFLLSYSIEQFIPFSKSETAKFGTTKIQLPSCFRSWHLKIVSQFGWSLIMNNMWLHLLQSVVGQQSVRYLKVEIFLCHRYPLNLLKCNISGFFTIQNMEKVFHKIKCTRVRSGMLILMLLNYYTGTSQLLTVKPELFDF